MRDACQLSREMTADAKTRDDESPVVSNMDLDKDCRFELLN
jgi:hypothetical protein